MRYYTSLTNISPSSGEVKKKYILQLAYMGINEIQERILIDTNK